MTNAQENEEDQFRRDLTRRVNIVLRQLQAKEMWLEKAPNDTDKASRVIASCEVAALQFQYDLLHEAMLEVKPEYENMTMFSSGTNGYVQGGVNRAVDPDEISSARLVNIMRECDWLRAMPLPWSWSFDRSKGSVFEQGQVVSMGRYLIVKGNMIAPRVLAYLARAGALFPSLVREVIALRITLVADKSRAADTTNSPYEQAEALLRS